MDFLLHVSMFHFIVVLKVITIRNYSMQYITVVKSKHRSECENGQKQWEPKKKTNWENVEEEGLQKRNLVRKSHLNSSTSFSQSAWAIPATEIMPRGTIRSLMEVVILAYE
jgi:hypothetical protein